MKVDVFVKLLNQDCRFGILIGSIVHQSVSFWYILVGLVNLLSNLSLARLVCHTRRMDSPSINRHKNHRFPVEIISHGVWLYYRFCLSYRDVKELLFARGVTVTYEAIRKWCRKFGRNRSRG